MAIFQLNVSAIGRQTAGSSVRLIAKHRILTTIPKHSTFWDQFLKNRKLFGALFDSPWVHGLFLVALIIRQRQIRLSVVYDE